MAPKNKGAAAAQREPVRLYEEFKINAEAVSARVYRVANSPGAALKFAEIVQEKGAKKVAVASSPLVESLRLNEVLGEDVSIHCRDLRLHSVEADLGVSGLDLAIAETGTLAQDAGDMDSRLVSMLPPVHVALVRTDCLVATLREALERYQRDLHTLPSYLTFISGPSRTADIERVLTIGVHGPGELHIIFVDQPGGEGL